METKLIEGHPRIEEVRNQVVIKRGPIVYCIETPDLPPGSRVLDVYLIGDQQLNAVYHSDLLGGITTIQGEIGLRTTDDRHMYSPITKPLWEKHNVQFVPYYAWSNRGTAEMTVFLPVIWSTPHT